MPRFLYKAKKAPNEVIEGQMEADSERAVVSKLIESGVYPVWIKEEFSLSEDKAGGSFFLKRITNREIASFTRQLSELLDSGLPLFDSLGIIENQTEQPRLKAVITNIRNSIKDGNTFSESLRSYPRIFSNLYVNLAKSGETGGMLNEVLSNIADFLEKQEDLRSKLIVALTYPLLMAIVGTGTIFILIGFVIPRLTDMFVEMGEVLPLPTRMLIGMGGFIKTYWFFAVLFVALFIFVIRRGEANKVTRKTIDRFKLKLPIFGKLIKNSELARFSKTLAALLKNGVPILDSLQITSDVMDNELIKDEVMHIYSEVKKGETLTSAIKKNTSFPQFIVNMTAVGEEGGFLDKMLLKVGKSYEIETDRIIQMMSSLLEPVMILIMGLIVGFVVISMLLPVFQISMTAH